MINLDSGTCTSTVEFFINVHAFRRNTTATLYAIHEEIMNSKLHACAFDEGGNVFVITSRPISRFQALSMETFLSLKLFSFLFIFFFQIFCLRPSMSICETLCASFLHLQCEQNLSFDEIQG